MRKLFKMFEMVAGLALAIVVLVVFRFFLCRPAKKSGGDGRGEKISLWEREMTTHLLHTIKDAIRENSASNLLEAKVLKDNGISRVKVVWNVDLGGGREEVSIFIATVKYPDIFGFVTYATPDRQAEVVSCTNINNLLQVVREEIRLTLDARLLEV